MKQLLALICLSMMIFTTEIAAETLESCANGGGTVVTGAITGHKYCKSNNAMTWWNAYVWCDGQGKRLFSLTDCQYSITSTTACPEIVGVSTDKPWIWTATLLGSSKANYANLSSGIVNVSGYNYSQRSDDTHYRAFCY